METLYVHADESCLGNQFQARSNPGGAAGLVEAWRDGGWERHDYWLSEPDTTNNRMAIRSALDLLASLDRPTRIHFVSDSQYLVKGINEWLAGWKRANWRRKTGAVKNVELWKALDRELQRHQLEARWVRGHHGHPENEYVDHLATTAAADSSASGGLVPSGFQSWLDAARERGQYLDYMEFQPPLQRFGVE